MPEGSRITPLAAISQRLRNESGVTFVFGVDLGESQQGYKYRGRFHIPTKTIFIDQSLPEGEPRFNFTLAHEIAHFVLHRRINPKILGGGDDAEISDTNRDLILDQIQGDNPRTWIEWQANKWASSVLLPRSTVPSAVRSKQQELGVTRNLGTLYLDRQRGNVEDFMTVLRYMERIYQVSRSAIRIRLRELNLLHEATMTESFIPRGPESVNSVLGRIIDFWETEWSKAKDED